MPGYVQPTKRCGICGGEFVLVMDPIRVVHLQVCGRCGADLFDPRHGHHKNKPNSIGPEIDVLMANYRSRVDELNSQIAEENEKLSAKLVELYNNRAR